MIDIQIHGDIHELRLNRPPVNALNHELLNALIATVEAAPKNGARGLILSGGVKVFSGGLDVPELIKLDRDGLKRTMAAFFGAAKTLAKSPLPIAAAIAGHNPAGGCVLALCCDYRVMARGPFRIGLNETQVGLAVPEAVQYLMRRIVGPQRAERLIVTGAMLESDQAYALGLVDELTDTDGVVVRAAHWLTELLALPSTPMLATRRTARADLIAALEGFNEEALERFVEGWHSPDSQAALHALLARLKK
jgi:enoyl-CoA hydratase/carnithine racemase